MKGIRDRLEFRPRRLPKAVDVLRQQHPLRAGRPGIFISDTRSTELIRRVLEIQADRLGLQRLGLTLEHAELRAVLLQVPTVPELAAPLQTMIPHHAARKLERDCWRVLEAVPGSTPLWALLGRMLNRRAPRSWLPDGWELMLGSAANAEDPLQALVRTLDMHDLPIEPGEDQGEGLPFRRDTELISRLGILRQVRSQGESLMLDPVQSRADWWKVMGPDDRIAAGRNYLHGVPAYSWEAALIREVEESFGVPGSSRSRSEFWDGVSDSERQAFRDFVLGHRLDQAMAGDTDRHRYWRQWLDEISDLRVARAGSVEFAVLDFGGFGVIEFFEKGNAAYFYSASDLAQIEDSRARNVADLKRILNYRVPRRFGRMLTGNRLIHSGRWHPKADGLIRAFARHFND